MESEWNQKGGELARFLEASTFKNRDSPKKRRLTRTSRPSFQAENRSRWPIGESLLSFPAVSRIQRGSAACESALPFLSMAVAL
jgi:hypothetical protein